MSREIKFRGFCIDWQEWIYGDLIRFSDTIMVCVANKEDDFSQTGKCHCDVYEETVGQYIGVKDKNGKEIYEGDIVKIHQFLFDGCEYEKEIIVSIEYTGDMACFVANLLQAKEIRAYMGYNNETDKQERVVVPLSNFYGLHEESFEVIGNVYENADLLKEAGNE